MAGSIDAPMFGSIAELELTPGASLLSIHEDPWIYDYFFNRTGSKTLLVFLPSAAVRGKRMVPAFRRWTWSSELPEYDVLSVSDPAMRLDERMLGAWCIGTKTSWPLIGIIDHLKQFRERFGYDDIVLCGSSLGGFMALQMDILAKGRGLELGRGGAYVENPQVNLLTYSAYGHIDLVAKVGFGAENRNLVPPSYLDRFDVTKLMAELGVAPQGILVIKESDTHHFEDQVPQLVSAIEKFGPSNLEIEVIPKEEDDTGHTPLDLIQMMERVKKLLARER